MIENEQAFYDAYAFFFQLPFSFQKKNVLFTALMAGEPWGWRVIGITEAALESLAKHDFRYTPRLICRSHLVGRIETAKEIFTKKIPKEQFFRRFLETDVTVIALKSENTRGGPSKYIPIDLEQNLFPSRFVAFRHGPAERKYLRDLHAACRAGKVTPTARTVPRNTSVLAKRVEEEKRVQEHGDRKRWTFWNRLLERAKAKTSLHANIRASNRGWVGTGAGGKGLEYNYVIGKNWARVELYFNSGDKTINKPIFDALSKSREEIQRSFGESLEWDRLDGKTACRIGKSWNGKGLADEDDWQMIQDKMIDGMIRLSGAMRGPIAALPR